MYGEWLVLTAIPTYLTLSDLSFSSVAGNSMVMLEAAGKRTDAIALGRHLWSIVTLMTGAATIVVISGSVVVIAMFDASSTPAIPRSDVQVVLVALFLQVPVAIQYGPLDAWYRCAGRYPLGASMRQVGRLIEFSALIVAVVLGGTPADAAIALLGGSVVGLLASWIVLRRAVPWATFKPEIPHWQTFRQLLRPGVAYMAFPTANAISAQGLTLVVGLTLGPASVVVFTATRTVTRSATLVMASINSAIWPELSRAVGGALLPEARAILRRSVQLSLAASLIVVCILGLFGQEVIEWWTHGSVVPPTALLLLLLAVLLGNATWYTLLAALAATNRHERAAAVYLAATIVAVVSAVPLSTSLGLTGAAAALLAIDVLMLVYVFRTSLRVVDDLPLSFLRSLLDVWGPIRAMAAFVRPAL